MSCKVRDANNFVSVVVPDHLRPAVSSGQLNIQQVVRLRLVLLPPNYSCAIG